MTKEKNIIHIVTRIYPVNTVVGVFATNQLAEGFVQKQKIQPFYSIAEWEVID